MCDIIFLVIKMLIDTHCHVLSCEYDNTDKIIKEAFDSGVDKIFINGFDEESSKEAVVLSNKYKNVYAAIGIGPENIESYNDNTINLFQELIDNNKVIAIGEIGSDYYWTTDNKDEQIFVFKKMLELAKKNNLPVIVHSREATLDTYNLLKEYGVSGIMHCFSGSIETAKMYKKIGFLLGIGGVITFKNARKLTEVVKEMDLNDFSLETDSPYLSPEPYRGKKNHPKNICYVAKKIAEIKGIEYNEVLDKTTDNIMSKFDL